MNIRKFSLVLIALAVLGNGSLAEARGRKFSCPMDDKRACMSAEDVYSATNLGQNLEYLASGNKPKTVVKEDVAVMGPRPPEPVGGAPVASPDRCCNPVRTQVTVKGDTLAVASPVVYPPATRVDTVYTQPRREDMVVRTTREEPFRVPAKVIRIFISPWEDEQGDLHMGGYVFSEIAPRKWTVGTHAESSDAGYRLLTLNSPVRDAAQDAKTNGSEATAEVNRSE